MAHQTGRVEPIIPSMVIDPNWEQMGLTWDGRLLFRERSIRQHAVPDIDPKTGLQKFARNPMTGEALYLKNKRENFQFERIFTVEYGGSSNLIKMDYDPSAVANEQQEKARKARAAERMERLLAVLERDDVNPEELVAKLRQEVRDEKAVASVEPEPTVPAAPVMAPGYPKKAGKGLWYLSPEHEEQVGFGVIPPYAGTADAAQTEAERILGLQVETVTARADARAMARTAVEL